MVSVLAVPLIATVTTVSPAAFLYTAVAELPLPENGVSEE
jgi:hypothetical protein